MILPAPDDPRALRILFDTYWSPTGWKKIYQTPPADLAYAISAGAMFTAEAVDQVTHDAVLDRLHLAAAAVSSDRLAESFLGSLTTRRPALRSALASYAVARVLPAHAFDPGRGTGLRCQVCGYRGGRPADRSVLNFERHKWGGVRHLDPYYCAFDLETFPGLSVAPPADADRACFRTIVHAAQTLPPIARARDLEKALARILPSNRDEREMLLGILGLCGILPCPGQPPRDVDGASPRDQDLPPIGTVDWSTLSSRWRGGNVSVAALAGVFPDLSLS